MSKIGDGFWDPEQIALSSSDLERLDVLFRLDIYPFTYLFKTYLVNA